MPQAARVQAVVTRGVRDELRFELRRRRKAVAGRIRVRRAARQHVPRDVRSGQERGDRIVADPTAGTDEAVAVVLGEVVRVDEPEDGRAVHVHDARRVILRDRVVVDRDVARPAGQQEKIAAAAPVLAVDVGEHVVAHRNRLRLPARMIVVVTEDVDARCTVTHHVPLEVDVIHGAPRAAAVLVTDGEHDREPRLPALPVVLQGVTNDRDASRVLQLDQVLDDPALVAPNGLLGELISADRDV